MTEEDRLLEVVAATGATLESALHRGNQGWAPMVHVRSTDRAIVASLPRTEPELKRALATVTDLLGHIAAQAVTLSLEAQIIYNETGEGGNALVWLHATPLGILALARAWRWDGQIFEWTEPLEHLDPTKVAPFLIRRLRSIFESTADLWPDLRLMRELAAVGAMVSTFR